MSKHREGEPRKRNHVFGMIYGNLGGGGGQTSNDQQNPHAVLERSRNGVLDHIETRNRRS